MDTPEKILTFIGLLFLAFVTILLLGDLAAAAVH